MRYKAKRIVTSDGLKEGIINVENGKIISIEKADKEYDYDFNEAIIIPGIIDTHNHGTMGYSMMEATDDPISQVRGYLKGLASQGVTGIFPTAGISLFEVLAKIAKEESDGAEILGIHSEGPYLNRVGEKGVDKGHPDIDIEYVKEMVSKGNGYLKLVALAPELEGSKEMIEYLQSQGIRTAFAHSNMNYSEALKAFDWGISVITHTANVMSGIHHRNMGGLGAALLSDDVYNEIICDGLHVSNEMIELMFRVKKDYKHKFMMISDNVAFAGAPVGRYKLSEDFICNIDELGYCLTDTGRLCGSTIPVIKGMKNLYYNLHLPLDTICQMSSKNVADVYSLRGKGSISVGNDADFVVINDDFDVLKTYVRGKCVYDNEKDLDLFNPEFINVFKA